MLIRLIWTIDHEYIVVVGMVILFCFEFIAGARRFIKYKPRYVDTYIFIDVVTYGSTYDNTNVSSIYTNISVYLMMVNIILIHFHHAPSLWLEYIY
jgi:hypothetical protein